MNTYTYRTKFVLLFILASFVAGYSNGPGSLDLTFAGTGYKYEDLEPGNEWGRKAVVQPDGKVIVTGVTPAMVGIVRYFPDGSLDTSFGTGGRVMTAFSSSLPAHTTDLLLQPDGKIIIVGSDGGENDRKVGVARFNSDGSPDTSFGGDGNVTAPVFGTPAGFADSVAIQPDGKIVVTAYGAPQFPPLRFAIIRFNADGSLDTTFDGDGELFPTNFEGHDVRVQPDGKIVVGGGFGTAFAVARYNSNGTPDTSFDGDGVAWTLMGTGNAYVYSLKLLPDGRILAGGYTFVGSEGDFALARFNPDGSLDTSFDGDGKVLTPILPGYDLLYELAIQSDGKIIAAGTTNTASSADVAVVRYNSDGSLDPIYGSGGKALIDLGAYESAGGLALDAADNAYIVGTAYQFLTIKLTANSAPLVEVGGRVTSSANGQGIGGATVVLTDANNVSQTARTNAFGYYSFPDVSSNEIYTVRVSSKRYRFQPSSQTITLTGSVANVDFVGNPGSESKSIVTGSEKEPANHPKRSQKAK
jgi:uncharacterized delta-60 repeat protein